MTEVTTVAHAAYAHVLMEREAIRPGKYADISLQQFEQHLRFAGTLKRLATIGSALASERRTYPTGTKNARHLDNMLKLVHSKLNSGPRRAGAGIPTHHRSLTAAR